MSFPRKFKRSPFKRGFTIAPFYPSPFGFRSQKNLVYRAARRVYTRGHGESRSDLRKNVHCKRTRQSPFQLQSVKREEGRGRPECPGELHVIRTTTKRAVPVWIVQETFNQTLYLLPHPQGDMNPSGHDERNGLATGGLMGQVADQRIPISSLRFYILQIQSLERREISVCVWRVWVW